jgi:penicillin amidase
MKTIRRLLLGISLLAALGACGRSNAPAGSGSGNGNTPADALVLKAGTALPPGQSGFFSLAGQAQGTLTGVPSDYGAHVDDQRPLYWNFNNKPAVLGTRPGTPDAPKDGVQIYRDSYGVPIVYAGTVRDLWFGVGYAVAQDRLFLMDAVRRMGAGTFAELTGCGSVAADIQQRTLAYSDAEYQSFFDNLSQDSKDSVLGYLDGANAWRAQAMLDPSKLPAEYALLTTTPAAFTVKDVLAAGVFITRFVAAEGGNEFLNIEMLKRLEEQLGSRQAAQDAFQDMVWLEDPKAVTTVPLSEGTFSNQSTLPAQRDAVFQQLANWSVGLPETIWKGAGTGNAAAPAPCGMPSLPALLGSAGGLGAGEVLAAAPMPRAAPARQVRAVAKALAVREAGLKVVRALQELRAYLHGGSFALAIGKSRTRDGGTLMISEPQLGYSYPLLLVEYEIHGPNGYDARGSSVPILPVVGIGYTNNAAWGLTTGYSKTIDSFIETTCSTAQQQANTCKANQYFHLGLWKDMDCRSETVSYRAAAKGIPVGLPILSQSAQICRTVHGPVVARDDAKGMARSVKYAMFGREIDTIEGIREWNRAKSFEEFRAAAAKLTWNENATVATRDGHIAYFHPGLHIRRNANTDQRLPTPGTGEFDPAGLLSFDETPKVIDPAQGYLANWNTKPALGWLDGEGLGNTSRPGGAGQRVTNILDQLGARSDWSFADLRQIDINTGTTDARAREYLPVIQAFRNSATAQLSDVQKAALDLMLAWDHRHFGPGIDINNASATDGPAATVFGEYVIALRDELFAPYKTLVIDPGVKSNGSDRLTIYSRVAGVGSHVYDQSVMDNLLLRILDPSSSGLALHHDFTGARGRDVVMLAALNTAMTRLATSYNGGAALTTAADLDKCRRVHPRSQLCSLTGVIGPGSGVLAGTVPPADGTLPLTSCVTMPFEDRGGWVQHVGYEKP